ncbi:MAG TPA: hypothetical protein VGW57_16840 [Chthoniobacterales bacterium]|nr:hypothetical protein [Chthoniobacterales bacterium]
MKNYSDTMTLEKARALFFARSGLGEDGGYSERWVRVETKPIPVYFPNTACRVEAAKLHDLHHIANEYETDWAGEAEIAAWEIAGGCGRHGWAWLLNLGAFTIGMFLFPRRLYRAFLRGRRCANLYRDGFPESELREKTVEWLRARLRPNPGCEGPTIRDRISFAFWCGVGLGFHGAWFVAGAAILWWIVARIS